MHLHFIYPALGFAKPSFAKLALIASMLLMIATSIQSEEDKSLGKPISIDTPLMELIKNDAAKTIVSKHLTNLVERFENDFEVQDFFYDATLRELSVDDNHVIGFTEEMLIQIEAELKTLEESGN
jgi:hypothetical protein